MLKVIKFSSIFIVLSIFTACAGHKKSYGSFAKRIGAVKSRLQKR